MYVHLSVCLFVCLSIYVCVRRGHSTKCFITRIVCIRIGIDWHYGCVGLQFDMASSSSSSAYKTIVGMKLMTPIDAKA